jgi:HK97 family phage major capsid protein
MQIDVDKLVAELTARMGDKFGPVMAEVVDQKIKDLGLDRVDRKFSVFPGTEDAPAASRAAAFLRAAILHSEPADGLTRKALSEGSDGAGGYLVPVEFRGELLRRLPELSELYPHVRTVPVITDSGDYPKLSTDVTITWGRAENDEIDETDPVFDHLTWTVRNMSAITYMSRELASDSNPGIVQTVIDLFSEAVAAERDKMIAIGNGSTQPAGIYSASGLTGVTVDGTLSYAKLVEIKYALARRYHRNARWVLSSTNLQRITGLVDDNDQPIMRDALVAGETPIILGKPFSVQDDLPDDAIWFGDLSQYLWFDRQRMIIESTSTGGDTFRKHQVAIKVVERCDGKLALSEAFVKGTGITG